MPHVQPTLQIQKLLAEFLATYIIGVVTIYGPSTRVEILAQCNGCHPSFRAYNVRHCVTSRVFRYPQGMGLERSIMGSVEPPRICDYALASLDCTRFGIDSILIGYTDDHAEGAPPEAMPTTLRSARYPKSVVGNTGKIGFLCANIGSWFENFLARRLVVPAY